MKLRIGYALAAAFVFSIAGAPEARAGDYVPPPMMITHDPALPGVGVCAWGVMGADGQHEVMALLEGGADWQDAVDYFGEGDRWPSLVGRCDPRFGQHELHSTEIIVGYALKEAAAALLARAGVAKDRLDAAWTTAPGALRAAVDREADERLSGAPEAPPVADWTPVLKRLGIQGGMRPGGAAWLATIYYRNRILAEKVREAYAAG